MSERDVPLTVALVSAPGSSFFMQELLAGVGDADAAVGAPDVTIVHDQGLVYEVLDRRGRRTARVRQGRPRRAGRGAGPGGRLRC